MPIRQQVPCCDAEHSLPWRLAITAAGCADRGDRDLGDPAVERDRGRQTLSICAIRPIAALTVSTRNDKLRFEGLTLTVESVERAIELYSGKLGLKVE